MCIGCLLSRTVYTATYCIGLCTYIHIYIYISVLWHVTIIWKPLRHGSKQPYRMWKQWGWHRLISDLLEIHIKQRLDCFQWNCVEKRLLWCNGEVKSSVQSSSTYGSMSAVLTRTKSSPFYRESLRQRPRETLESLPDHTAHHISI